MLKLLKIIFFRRSCSKRQTQAPEEIKIHPLYAQEFRGFSIFYAWVSVLDDLIPRGLEPESREYCMIYRGPDFLTVVRFGSSPPSPLLSLRSTGDTGSWERKKTCQRERGWGRSQTIRPQEAWFSINHSKLHVWNTLWSSIWFSHWLFCFDLGSGGLSGGGGGGGKTKEIKTLDIALF